MSNPAVSFVPFKDYNTFQESMKYLELTNIPSAARVCKSWNTLIQSSTIIWKNIFEKEGIPHVSSSADKPRNYREDFKVLYPRTISSRIIGEYIGKVVGKVPPISEECFNRLQEEDPFEKGKLIRENYIFVVVPAFIQRTFDKKITPMTLNRSRNLIPFKQKKKRKGTHELMIPLSLNNFKVLCEYPLKGKENKPVFNKYSRFEEIFNECDICPDKITVYFMRKHMAEQTRGMTYEEQEEFAKGQGFEITPLRERTLFNAVEILRSGMCPDKSQPWSIAVTCDISRYGNSNYRVNIGGFYYKAGLHVNRNSVLTDPAIVPGIQAEVPQTKVIEK